MKSVLTKLGIILLNIIAFLGVLSTLVLVSLYTELRETHSTVLALNTELTESFAEQSMAYGHQTLLLKSVTENSTLLNQIPGMTALVSEATNGAVDKIVGGTKDIEDAAEWLNHLLAKEIDKMPLGSIFHQDSGIIYTAYFGDDVLEGRLRKHGGIDAISETGNLNEPILAPKRGQVVEIGHDAIYGKYVVIDVGDGYQIKCGHMSMIYYTADLYQWVEKGQIIGLMGNTGYTKGKTGHHVHYEITRLDEVTGERRPVNPEPLIEYGRSRS